MADINEATRTEKLFAWPTPQDYNEAVQSPSFCFSDPELRGGETELNEFGLPRPISGGFASVYHVRKGEREYAVRCFLSRVSNLQFRYEAITEFLRESSAPWVVPCEFISEGMLIGSTRYPILKMEWVRGLTLGTWIEQNLDKPESLLALRERFELLVAELHASRIAHGDLQPANILVSEDSSLRLVDYDGMYVPGLAGARANEIGHKNFQHPERSVEHFDATLDHFSARLISTAIGIIARDNSLFNQFDCGDDALLFRVADLADPDHSLVFQTLEAHQDAEVAGAAKLLRSLCRGKLGKVPPLGEPAIPESELPDVEYTPPKVKDDVSVFQIQQRSIARIENRRKTRATKRGGGAMATIPGSLASKMAVDNARHRKMILYPMLSAAALTVLGVFGIRFLAYDTNYVSDWMSRCFQPAGTATFAAAHEAYDKNRLADADKKFAQAIKSADEPDSGMTDADLVEAYVHRAEIAEAEGDKHQALVFYRQASNFSKRLESGNGDWQPEFFAAQDLLCRLNGSNAKSISEKLQKLFATTPETARWTPWEIAAVYQKLEQTDVSEAIKFWNAWSKAVRVNGYDSHLHRELYNLAFSSADQLARSKKTEDRANARRLYEMVLNEVTSNVDTDMSEAATALAGLYRLAENEGNEKAAKAAYDRYIQLGHNSTRENFRSYADSRPRRIYRPVRYHLAQHSTWVTFVMSLPDLYTWASAVDLDMFDSSGCGRNIHESANTYDLAGAADDLAVLCNKRCAFYFKDCGGKSGVHLAVHGKERGHFETVQEGANCRNS